MILALQNLKENQHYQILVKELERIKDNIESAIFSDTTIMATKEKLIERRNMIVKFIELPDDLIQDEMIKEWNSAEAPNLG